MSETEEKGKQILTDSEREEDVSSDNLNIPGL